MTPKKQMIEFCKMDGEEQYIKRKEIIPVLEEFLKTADIDDLEILNSKSWSQGANHVIISHGLNLSVEVLLLLGAYGKLFFNTEKEQ